jgi:hypothetical protein
LWKKCLLSGGLSTHYLNGLRLRALSVLSTITL